MEARHSTSPGALDPEDSWTCPRCGWVYPNPHPSAKHRRNHKKHCGKIKGFELISEKHNGGSSDEASSDDETHIHKEHSLHNTHHVLPAETVVDIPQSSVLDVSSTMIEDDSSAATGGVSTVAEVVKVEIEASTGTSLYEVVPDAVKFEASPTQDGLPAGINAFAVAEPPPVLPVKAEAPMISTQIFPPVLNVSPPVGGELPLAAEQVGKVTDQVQYFEAPALGSSSSLSGKDVEVSAALLNSTVPSVDAFSEVSKGTEDNVKKIVALEENRITSGSNQTRDLFSLTKETSASHADLKGPAGESLPVYLTPTLNAFPEVSEVKKDEVNQRVSGEDGETRSATLLNDIDQAENLRKQEIAPVKTEKPAEQADALKVDHNDLWTCHLCGWTYPNAHPSAKHRRNHKKHCPKTGGSNLELIQAAAVVDGSSEEASSDDNAEQQGHESSEMGLPKAYNASTSWPIVVDSSSHDENVTQGPEQPVEPEGDRNSGHGTSDKLTEYENVSVTSIPVSSPSAIIEGETPVFLEQGTVVDTPIESSISVTPKGLAEGTSYTEENLETALELPAARLEKEVTTAGSKSPSRDLYTENLPDQNEIAVNTVFTVPNVVNPAKDNGEGLVESNSKDSLEQSLPLQEEETNAVTLTSSYSDKERSQDMANVKVGSEQESPPDIGAARDESNLQHDLPESSFKETLPTGEILASGSVVEPVCFRTGKVITEQDSLEQPLSLQEVETNAVTLTSSYPDKERSQDMANFKVGSEQESPPDIGAARGESNLQHDLPESSFKETLLTGEILASGSVVEPVCFSAGKVITEQDSASENELLLTWGKVDGDDLAKSPKSPLWSEEVAATGSSEGHSDKDKDACLTNASEHDSVSEVGSYKNTDRIKLNLKEPQHKVGNGFEKACDKAENVPQAAITITETKLEVDECNEHCDAANIADTFEIQKTLIDSTNAESRNLGFPGTVAEGKAVEPGLEKDSVAQTERWVPPLGRSDSLGTENFEDARDSLETCSVGGSVGEDEAAELEASLRKSLSDKNMGLNGSINLVSNGGVSGPPVQDVSTVPGKFTSAGANQDLKAPSPEAWQEPAGAAQDLKAPSPEAWQEPAGAAQDLKAPSPEAWQEPGVSEVASEDNDPQTEEVLSETRLQGIESEVKEDKDSKRHTPLRSLLAKEGSDKTGQKNTASSVEKIGDANEKWRSSSETKPKTRSIWSHCICCPAVH